MNEQSEAPQVGQIDLDNLGNAFEGSGIQEESTQDETRAAINPVGETANDAEKMTPDEANEMA